MERSVLSGKKIVVTRAKEQAASLLKRIEEAGGEPIPFPLLSFTEPDDKAALKTAICQLSSYDWIVFTSANGVKFFLKELRDTGGAIRRQKIAAVGKKTAELLKKENVKVDCMPKRFEGTELANELKGIVQPGERILVPKGNLAKSTILNKLGDTCEVTEIIVYETNQEVPESRMISQVETVDVIIFMSPSAVNYFSALGISFKKTPLVACVGPVTEREAYNNGFERVIVAEEYTEEGIIEAICDYFESD
ncbi:uroporphyrinogen-III synthase [Fictibacillus gelatini]|uniref:uroporphyrinogen-III synthase n=1 Tax=Fictibacillus gelatini TaxID=225985 RepID=UPI0003F589F8|nr:uroporphyrinogen-III synthase [Fictibacillus gelatini]